MLTVAEPQLAVNGLENFFPMEVIRGKQVKALEFAIERLNRGINDVVIEAPTGTGKTAIAIALGYWAKTTQLPGTPGAYMLVTQKLLQDQLEADNPRFKPGLQNNVLLKTAAEYSCPLFKNCALGGINKKKQCPQKKMGCCTYTNQKSRFLGSSVACTNYAYYFTERMYAGEFPNRQLVILDEAHNLENVILGFASVVVNSTEVKKYAAELMGNIPQFKALEEFNAWCRDVYLPVLVSEYEMLHALEEATDEQAGAVHAIGQLILKIKQMDESISHRDKWVFWSEDSLGETPVKSYIAKPLWASRHFKTLLSGNFRRVYLSAYLGDKQVFCRSLGLDPEQVSWIKLGSIFDPAKRPIKLLPMGSMGKKSIDQTFPKFIKALEIIMNRHKAEKGVIHCASYALAERIYMALPPELRGRIIYPKSAAERDQCFSLHSKSTIPTTILSPSMTEGFDLKDDLARWQVIAKVPFPSLGDAHTVAKKTAFPEWYAQRTISTIIQACGRVCRHENDYGITYILDKDFDILWRNNRDMFPSWFVTAVH